MNKKQKQYLKGGAIALVIICFFVEYQRYDQYGGWPLTSDVFFILITSVLALGCFVVGLKD